MIFKRIPTYLFLIDTFYNYLIKVKFENVTVFSQNYFKDSIQFKELIFSKTISWLAYYKTWFLLLAAFTKPLPDLVRKMSRIHSLLFSIYFFQNFRVWNYDHYYIFHSSRILMAPSPLRNHSTTSFARCRASAWRTPISSSTATRNSTKSALPVPRQPKKRSPATQAQSRRE